MFSVTVSFHESKALVVYYFAFFVAGVATFSLFESFGGGGDGFICHCRVVFPTQCYYCSHCSKYEHKYKKIEI